MSSCPCGSTATYEECCAPFIAGAPAPTAEALIRARYTAFLRGEVDYLGQTLTAEMRDRFDPEEVRASSAEASGSGIEIRRVEGGGSADDTAAIDYVARFRMRGQPHVHHELATLCREDGRWVYADAEVNPKTQPRQVARVGRNDPCPCGSGQKYKKCCGA